MMAIMIEQSLSLVGAEILKLHQNIGPSVSNSQHEFLYELVVILAFQSWLLDAEVEFILQEFRIVCANIQNDGKNSVGCNATGCAIQGQLSNGNTHSIGTQISQSKNSGSVCHDDNMHILVGPIINHGCHVTAVIFREVHTTWPAEARCKLFTSLTDSWSINERGHFFNVIDL
jgi:hypothetical protein